MSDLEDETEPSSATPASVFAAVPGLRSRLAALDLETAAPWIAGLMLEPAFAANAVRLDMAQRLILAAASGSKGVSRPDIFRLLNRDLVDAGLAANEDPPENFFIATIATRRGPFRLHLGVWERANSITEDLIEAFSRLPAAGIRDRTLDQVYALLSVSDLLAHRTGTGPLVLGEGGPQRKIDLPDNRELMRLAARCLIRWDHLETLGITEQHLRPFAYASSGAALEDQTIGTSEIEARPLLFCEPGIIVAAPHNLSVAMRVLLATRAVAGGIGPTLRLHLLDVQAERLAPSDYSPRQMRLDAIANEPIRHALRQESPGRYMSFIHVVDDFADPPFDFAAQPPAAAIAAAIDTLTETAQHFARQQPDFREGVTILLIGGWGRGRSFPVSAANHPADWPLIILEVGDAADVGSLENAAPSDLWRIAKQWQRVADQGFTLISANGWPNLFDWWRETGFNLVDEREDIAPPASIGYPTNGILSVRVDAANRTDRRPMPLPDGSIDMVVRLERDRDIPFSERRYVSTAALERGDLLGVALGPMPVWLRLAALTDQSRREATYETWQAAMHWLAIGLDLLGDAFDGLASSPVLIDLSIEWPDDQLHVDVDDDAIDRAIEVTQAPAGRVAGIHLRPAWQHGLSRMTNFAELRLGAAMLRIVLAANGRDVGAIELHALLFERVGSDDIRWRHSFVADRPVMLMRAQGVVDEFEPMPPSAMALARCGSAFGAHDRAAGDRIVGNEACFDFLMRQHAAQLVALLDEVARYDRTALVAAAFARLQSALSEDQYWARTARALRALHGPEVEAARSFARRNEINAVIRGCSILAEVAGSQAAQTGGLAVGEIDIDDLMAAALLVFQIAELVPPMRGGFLRPELRISPTGDILSDHSLHQTALLPTARLRHAQERVQADQSYRRHFEGPGPAGEVDRALFEAAASEYGAPFEAVRDLPTILAEIAVRDGQGVLIKRRSALLADLARDENLPGIDCGPLIDRLTLPARDGWLDIPEHARANDFDFSRFDRRYSIITRPLVALTTDPDPLLAIAPAVVERAALHNMTGALEGGLQGDFWDSAAMRSYVGKAAGRVGLAFNNEVAEALRALGLTAHASINVADALACKGTAAIKHLGDVDVLAIDPGGRNVWVVEAKEIKFCRTLSETASRLAEYRGRTDDRGRRDNLRKHLDRAEHIRAHAAELARRYKLPGTPRVRGLIVMGNHQPMAFVPSHESPDARFVAITALDEVDWSGA